jgi:branched-chain amino acid transport system ATP-binding protein
VLDNILLTLTSRKLFAALLERDNDNRRDEARKILESVGLWDKCDRPAGELSFGQRKLLEIARALAMNVQIYLFDEPFDGIHVRMLEIVRHLLKKLKEDGRTILFVSHNMDLIRELSDEVIVINSGSLIAQGTHHEVLVRQDVIESYLGT